MPSMPRIWQLCSALGLIILSGIFPATAQVIPPPAYVPPETVQPIPVPLPKDRTRLHALIITGENSYEHDWTGTTNAIRRLLQETGRFDVRVTEEFRGATADTLKPYDLVILNYLGKWNYSDPQEDRWGPVPEAALFDFVRHGKGIVVYHATLAMGEHPAWPEFELLAGGVLRGPPTSSRRSPPLGFRMHITDRNHPITKGMREYVWTLDDDMYVNLKWDPHANVHVLVQGYDDAAQYVPRLAGPKYPPSMYPRDLSSMKSTNQENPLVWTNTYGAGRVFVIAVGHGPDTLGYDAVRSLFQRGAEWAASGKVTIPPRPDAAAFAASP
jgi:type 1 glutamine amidotransferase